MNISINYTLQDIVAAVAAVLLFIPVLLAPGYVVGWFTDALRFRELSGPWRILVSLPLSVGLGPILVYWTGMGGWIPVWALYGICFLVWLCLLTGLWKHDPLTRLAGDFRLVPRSGWIIPAIWFLIVVVSLVDLQIHNGLYLSFADVDHEERAAITDAISRTGVRPWNPFYFIGAHSQLRYHYFWFLLCSIAEQMGGACVSPRQAIIASVVWSGWSLIALVPLYLRFFLERTGSALRRSSLVAICLFAVTGLDIVPTVLKFAFTGGILPEMEWWNAQVTSWFGSVLWVPHHVAALVACLIGFLVTWEAGRAPSLRRRITGGMLAGMAFATATGTSIYVTLVFAVFLVAWTMVTWFGKHRAFTQVLVISGSLTALLSAPYLMTLAGFGSATGSASASGGSFLKLHIREFFPLGLLPLSKGISVWQGRILRVVSLPLSYFLELGFFGIAGLLYLRTLRNDKRAPLYVSASVWMIAVSVGICTFIRSGVSVGNDLGWRGFLPAQFILLLWGADLIIQRGETAVQAGRTFHSGWLRSPVWAPLILLGLAGTIYELVLLRSFFLWNDRGVTASPFHAPDRHFGERAMELRRAYDAIHQILPANAITQDNPEWHHFDFFAGLYSERQTAVADPDCGTLLGGDPANCTAAFANLSAIFDGRSDMTWDRVRAVCRALAIDALVVDDLDGAWQQPQSWTWQAEPFFAEGRARVYLIR